MEKKLTVWLQEIDHAIETQDFKVLKQHLNETATPELKHVFDVCEIKAKMMVFRLLSKTAALDLFEALDASAQSRLILNFNDKETLELFKYLEPDDQVDLLDELPAAVAKQIIQSLPQDDRDDVALLMGYPKGSVGRLMTPHYVRLNERMTVSDALTFMKEKAADVEVLDRLFVTNETRQLKGFVALSALVLADDATPITELLDVSIAFSHATEEAQTASKKLQDYDLTALPVVDSENRLIGLFTVDDAMDILEEEAIEAALSKAGFADSFKETSRSKILTQGRLWQVWRVRVPYLMIALTGGLIAGLAIEQFEDALEAVAALAFFIPVIMDMGGNVGTQSSTIFTRALIFGHINFRRFTKQWFREILIGFTMGLLAATVAGAVVFLWQGDIRLMWTVSLALVATITIASAVGFLVPALLSRLGFDQAAGSDPFITTIKDITGLIIYFYLAMWIMGL